MNKRLKYLRLRLTYLVIVALLAAMLVPFLQRFRLAALQNRISQVPSFTVFYGDQHSDRASWVEDANYKPTAPEWLRQIFGDDFFRTIVRVERRPPVDSGNQEMDSLRDVARLPTVRELLIFDADDAVIDVIANMQHLEEVALDFAHVTPHGIETLSRLKELKTLRLSGCPGWSAALLPHLVKFNGVESIVLDDIGEDGLQCLAAFTSLRRLMLGNTRIRGYAFAAFANPLKLESLDLGGTNVSDETIGNLRRFVNLRSLSLWRTSISNEGLAALQSLKRLESLDLSETLIMGDGLKSLCGSEEAKHPSPLCGLPGLKDIRLHRTKIDDKDLRWLENCRQLEVIDLGHCTIGDSAGVHLSKLIHLRILVLDSTYVTDEIVNDLAGLTCMQTLMLPSRGASAESASTEIEGSPGCKIEHVSRCVLRPPILTPVAYW